MPEGANADVMQPLWITRLEESVAADAPSTDQALLLDYPVESGLERQEWRHDLLREFQLITYGSHDQPEHLKVPLRLLALADEMTSRYGRLIEEHTDELERALAAGLPRAILRYPLLPGVRELEIQFAKVMEESDRYCRQEALMTLSPSPETYAIRRWVIEEVVRQYDGHPPRSWLDFVAEVEREQRFG